MTVFENRNRMYIQVPEYRKHKKLSFAGQKTINLDTTQKQFLTKQYQNMIPLSKKHRITLEKIFENPVRSDVAWSDIEKLLIALDATITEGNGSRLRITLNDRRRAFHRPHPQKETDKGALKSVRDFLSGAGVGNA